MIIAIDFDGTITEDSPYPITGAIREDAKKYIPLLKDKGHTLILWTARFGGYLDEAIDLLDTNNLLDYFTYINNDGGKNSGRKISADFYFDDRSIFGKLDWDYFYKYICTTSGT